MSGTSAIKAFGLGFLAPAIMAVALVAVHNAWAPPSPDIDQLHPTEPLQSVTAALKATAREITAQVRNIKAQIGTGYDSRFANGTNGNDSERALTRNIQAELRRIGCFTGPVDGRWSPDTRRAMQTFTEKVGAALPVTRPNYIQLTLLQGYGSQSCASPCEGVDCTLWQTVARPAAPDATAVARSVRSNPTTAVSTAAEGRGDAPAATRQTAAPTYTAVESESAIRPLPGRMTVGGPGAGPRETFGADQEADTAASQNESVRTATTAKRPTPATGAGKPADTFSRLLLNAP